MFYINVSNGLLTKEHRERVGSAVWEFMWCLDKITKIDNNGIGYVLGGKPINLSDLSEKFGTSEMTASRNLQKLEEEGYIKKTLTPYGIVIKVMKAKKRFNKNVEPNRFNNNVEPHNENVEPNKTVSVDSTDKTLSRSDEVFSFKEKMQEMKKNPDKRMLIIAFYWYYKGWKFENKDQYGAALRRELRPAKDLTGFSIKQISSSMEFCSKEYKVWTLETVAKRINDLVNKNE